MTLVHGDYGKSNWLLIADDDVINKLCELRKLLSGKYSHGRITYMLKHDKVPKKYMDKVGLKYTDLDIDIDGGLDYVSKR